MVLGFTSFFITFVAVGFLGGKPLYDLFTADFGIYPGQWNGLCILSAFFSVCWTWLIFLFLLCQYAFRRQNTERDSIIDQLSQRGPGSKILLPDHQQPTDQNEMGTDTGATPTPEPDVTPEEIGAGSQGDQRQ